MRRFRTRHGLEVPGQSQAYTKVSGDDAEAQTEPATSKPVLDDPDAMLRQRGLEPDHWEITHVTVNEYQGPASAEHSEKTGQTSITYYQTKFTCRKRNPDTQLIPARVDGINYSTLFRDTRAHEREAKRKLVVLVGDQQAPFQDEKLHKLFCSWLAQNVPHEGVLMGDTVDYPDVSKHREKPEVSRTLKQCNDSGYDMLRDYVEHSPATNWTKIAGNHDIRIDHYVIEKAPALINLSRANSDERILAVEYLLRLDELGIEYVKPPQDNWQLGQVNVTNQLAARHGWLAKKGAGATALATLETLGYSVVVGHTHRQGKVYKTVHDIMGNPKTVTGVETGCMCRLDLGHAVSPDWQQGFATATVEPDGSFNLELATYDGATLRWRDQIYG